MATITFDDQEFNIVKCNHRTLGEGFEIDFTQMYEPPILSFFVLNNLSEYFGTVQIDFDNVSRKGCETCDYGSKYGYKIQVYQATKNIPEFD